MRIVSCKKLDSCIDGDFAFKYDFDDKWNRDSILKLKDIGQLRYYDSFPIPMFNIKFPNGTIMKGLEGTCESSLFFSRDNIDSTKKYFENLFTKEE